MIMMTVFKVLMK